MTRSRQNVERFLIRHAGHRLRYLAHATIRDRATFNESINARIDHIETQGTRYKYVLRDR